MKVLRRFRKVEWIVVVVVVELVWDRLLIEVGKDDVLDTVEGLVLEVLRLEGVYRCIEVFVKFDDEYEDQVDDVCNSHIFNTLDGINCWIFCWK